MRWRSWLGACVISTCAQPVSVPDQGCAATHSAPANHAPEVQACLAARQAQSSGAEELCERAWAKTGDEAAAVAGARDALIRQQDAVLERWEARAQQTTQGARILAYAGEMRQRRGDFDGAEQRFRRAFGLLVDRDPARATNAALWLLALVQSSQPAEQSIALARLAWEQAELSHDDQVRVCAAISLIEVLVDIGELTTAAAVIERMDAGHLPDWKGARDLAMGRIEAARGHDTTAIALFRRASRYDSPAVSSRSGLPYDAFELVQALLDDGQVAEARRELERARALVQQRVMSTHDIEARLAAAEAQVELAEDDIDAALASAERGLEVKTRDAAVVRLLSVKGDALARRGDALGAERAWREAADSVEVWRESIPTTQLRTRLVERHRHALESWLDSTGERHDAEGALEVTRRILGRELLDRIYQREANAPATADASVRDLEHRLAVRRELGVTMAGASGRGDLRAVAQDMVVIMFGARSVWAIRHAHGAWSIERAGDRNLIRGWVDGYRRNIDDAEVAAALGDALFPEATLPEAGAPLVVMLDPELSDIALAGLRVGGSYLVERAPILEVLAPDLLFAAVPGGPWGPPVAIGAPSNDLPDAAREIHGVARETGASEHVGSGATRAVLEASYHAALLHVATHSSIEDGRSAFTLFDGPLSAGEIVNRRIAPRVAVIATCRSQLGDDPATSLVAAFLAAGSPAVIGVKRALGDQDGAALMRTFYHLHGATDPLWALALAQRAAIAAGLPPGAWATVSFFGVGGWIEN